MSSTPRIWPRPAEDGRRTRPDIPPLVDRLVRDMGQARTYRDEEQIAEATRLTINRVEHQFAQTNHPTLLLFLGWLDRVGPERASQAATPVLSQLGVALVPTAADGAAFEDASTGLANLTDLLGRVASAHLASRQDRRTTAPEFVEIQRRVAELKRAADLFEGAVALTVEPSR